MSRIDDALHSVARLFVDTAPLIYLIELHPVYLPVVQEVVRRIDEGMIEAYSSVITLTEVLTHPIRLGRSDLAAKYRHILVEARHFQLVPIDVAIAEIAAEVRARYNLRTPDALQVAAASALKCDAIIANDSSFGRITELRIILLDDLVDR